MTDRFVTMAYAMRVAIGLVNSIMVILFRSLLVPVVILCALLLAVIGAFVALAVTKPVQTSSLRMAAYWSPLVRRPVC